LARHFNAIRGFRVITYFQGKDLPEPVERVYSVDVGYKEDLQKVHLKIDGIANRLKTRPVERPGLLTRLSPAISGIVLLVAIGAWIQPQWSSHRQTDLSNQINGQIDAKLKDPLKEIGDLKVRVGEIRGMLAVMNLRHNASLSKEEFQATLPELKSSVEIARQEGVKLPSQVMLNLQRRFAEASQSAAAFWPAVSEFISYRSFNVSSAGTRELASTRLPNCRDIPLPPQKITKVIDQQHLEGSQPAWENCRVTLDSPDDAKRINTVLLTQLVRVVFKHCLVTYNGGPIGLIFYVPDSAGTTFMTESGPVVRTSLRISGQAVQFYDCLFEFSATIVPPLSGRKMTAALLTQDATSVRLPKG
jgi:hypothetical protein